MPYTHKIPEQVFCPASGEVCNFASDQGGAGIVDLCRGGILVGQSLTPPIICNNDGDDTEFMINMNGKAAIFCGAEIAAQCLRKKLLDAYWDGDIVTKPITREAELAMAVEYFVEIDEINPDTVALCAIRDICDGTREAYMEEM